MNYLLSYNKFFLTLSVSFLVEDVIDSFFIFDSSLVLLHLEYIGIKILSAIEVVLPVMEIFF
jgi:hypothetical protein